MGFWDWGSDHPVETGSGHPTAVGHEFEDYCEGFFSGFLEKRRSPYIRLGSYGDVYPDLELTDRDGRMALVECKWGTPVLREDQMEKYAVLSKFDPLVIMVGTGFDPRRPEKIFLIYYDDLTSRCINIDSISSWNIPKNTSISTVDELLYYARPHTSKLQPYPGEGNWGYRF